MGAQRRLQQLRDGGSELRGAGPQRQEHLGHRWSQQTLSHGFQLALGPFQMYFGEGL